MSQLTLAIQRLRITVDGLGRDLDTITKSLTHAETAVKKRIDQCAPYVENTKAREAEKA